MLKKNKVLIPKVSYPNMLESNEVKDTKEFGLEVAQAIQREWFNRNSGVSCPYYDKVSRYHRLRRYARGEHSTAGAQDLLGIEDGSEAYTNYNLEPIQILPKFVDLVVNQMTERLFEVTATANDNYSSQLKENKKKYLEKFIRIKPAIEAAKTKLGVDIGPPNSDEMPQSKEEVDLHMKMNEKTGTEIMAEEALKFTLDLNRFDRIQNQLIEDSTVIGIAAARRYVDVSKGIVIKYIDPANLVFSSVREPDFSDATYFGEVERITVSELRRRTGDLLTDEDIEDIGDTSRLWDSYHSIDNTDSEVNGKMVNILNFTFRTIRRYAFKKSTIKKSGGFRLKEKPSTFKKKNERSEYEVVYRDYEVWYKGSLVLGTEILFDYGLANDMPRKIGNLDRTMPEYVVYANNMYKGVINSLISRTTGYIDVLQQITIKIQQMVAKARPNGVYIDIDGLNEIDMGDGSFLSPLEVMKIYDETGNVLGTSRTAEGEYNYGKMPITELKNGIIDGIDRLVNLYNHYLTMLRDAIGIPVGVDASTPNPKMLVGVQQQVALSSNTATRHVLESVLTLTQDLATGITLNLGDILEVPNYRKVYEKAIGKINVEKMKTLQNYSMYDIGFMIELKPDAEQRQYLEQNIQASIAAGALTLDDAHEIRNINNYKLANQLLRVRRMRREKEIHEREKQLIDQQTKGNQEAAKITADSKEKEVSLQTKSEIDIIRAKTEAKKAEILAEEQSKSRLMKEEFEYNMELKGIEVDTKKSIDMDKEDRKDKRQSMNNTQKSAMEMERKKEKGGKALKFDSENIRGSIGMDGFGV